MAPPFHSFAPWCECLLSVGHLFMWGSSALFLLWKNIYFLIRNIFWIDFKHYFSYTLSWYVFFKFSGLLCYDLWHWFYFFRFYFLIVYICVFVCLHGLRARACSTWEGQKRDWISWITDSCEQPVLSVRNWTQILCYGSKCCQSLSIPPVCTWIFDTKFTFKDEDLAHNLSLSLYIVLV